MKGSKDVLSSILKTTQMGQIGIRSILKTPLRASLRSELNSQLKEYDAIEQEAHGIARSRGWELKELNPSIKSMTDMMTRTRLAFGDADSKAAAMMIQGNTKGSIKTLKNLHRYPESTGKICAISQKLLDTETDNIVQMQGYV